MSLEDTVELNNGGRMPGFGFGTFLMEPGEETVRSVGWALEKGYRLIDTASMYENEREVGAAVRESGLPREEVFVTTKLWNTDHGYDRVMAAFDGSLRRLDLEYIDLYLVHWPVEGLRMESWSAMEAIVAGDRCRAIGVSNYMVHHLEELLEGSDIPAAVNQIQLHPFCYQDGVLEFCLQRGIQVQAYCPLVRAKRFDNPALEKVSSRHGKTQAQVLLRWSLEHGAVPVPKSVHPEWIEENARVFDFELSGEEMEELDSLDEDFFIGWDPRGIK